MSEKRSASRARRLKIQKTTYSGMFLALALVLPFLTGQIPQIGSMLCPMHLPVLLCGFVCGWPWGLAVGFIAPLLRSILFGMPPMFPTAAAMAAELAAYGAVTGFLYNKLSHSLPMLYISLLSAMISGRVLWGAVRYLLAGFGETAFTFSMFAAGAVFTAIPGIILQLVLIPPTVLLLDRTGIVLNGEGL